MLIQIFKTVRSNNKSDLFTAKVSVGPKDKINAILLSIIHVMHVHLYSNLFITWKKRTYIHVPYIQMYER